MTDNDRGDTKSQLLKLVVAIIGAVGLILASNNLPYIHDLIFGPEPEPLTSANVLFSNYSNMYQDQIYEFAARIALKDSIENARSEISKITTELVPLNATEGGGFRVVHGTNTAGDVTVNVPLAGVKIDLKGDHTLTGARAFDITAEDIETSTTQIIPRSNPPGQNIARWNWHVVPRELGPHTLYLHAYRIYDNGTHETISYADISIDVTVIRAPSTLAVPTNVTALTNMTATAENVSEAATEEAAPVEEPAVVENETAEAPAAAEAAKNAGNATEPAKTEPGFESVFAITGLLAVAYMVLGRKH